MREFRYAPRVSSSENTFLSRRQEVAILNMMNDPLIVNTYISNMPLLFDPLLSPSVMLYRHLTLRRKSFASIWNGVELSMLSLRVNYNNIYY
jgi:hypothetical protein